MPVPSGSTISIAYAQDVNPGNRPAYIAILCVLGAFAAADAGHEDEDSFKSNWLVAELDCRGEAVVDTPTLTLPEDFVIAASARLSPEWTLPDCESR
jgi:hypothetical protein